MPVYIVKAPTGDRLVDAPTKQAAINYVVGETITVEAVTTSEMAAHLAAGMRLESATAKLATKEDSDAG